MQKDKLVVAYFVWLLSALPLAQAQLIDLDRAPIEYETATPDDAVTALIGRLRQTTLEHDDDHGYLRSVLAQLEVPVSSQVLVFSRTSLQRSRISPKTPRAIYFNDEVAVGFCLRGDVLEISAADPHLGTTLYTVDQDPAQGGAITRQTETCLQCHGASATQGLPGHLLRSVFPDATGEPLFSRGTKRVDHTTPFADRWGGWYVTGRSGQQTHQGNKVFGRQAEPAEGVGTNVVDLAPYFTVANYLSPHSDLVALMVLEHQTEGHNRLVRANLLTRLALLEQTELNKALGRPDDEAMESITRRIDVACEPLVKYLVFSEEARLECCLEGSSLFATEFAVRGPFDARGRSLREFDLRTRLFRYPLSYLVYTRAFDGLPPAAKNRVYLRLWEVLTGRDRSPPFVHLSAVDRQAALEILRETKLGLPVYWQGSGQHQDNHDE